MGSKFIDGSVVHEEDMFWVECACAGCQGSPSWCCTVNWKSALAVWMPALHLVFNRWLAASSQRTQRLFNFSPCWSDYSNFHLWDAVIRILEVPQPLAASIPPHPPPPPPSSTMCSWTAPNRYPFYQPLLTATSFPLWLKTYCVVWLADGNLFMKKADIFFFFFFGMLKWWCCWSKVFDLFFMFLQSFWCQFLTGLFGVSLLMNVKFSTWSFSSRRSPSSRPSVGFSPWVWNKMKKNILQLFFLFNSHCPKLRLSSEVTCCLLDVSPHFCTYSRWECLALLKS